MRGDELALVLLASKPLIYGWLFAIPRHWVPKERRPSRWRPVLAALVRTGLGWLVGLPTALLTIGLGSAGAMLALAAVRFLIWFGIAKAFFPAVPAPRLLLFSAACTALNGVLDYTLFGGPWTEFSIC